MASDGTELTTELTTFHTLGDGEDSQSRKRKKSKIAGLKARIKVNEDSKEFSDDDDNMMGGNQFNVPTPRSPDDDLTLALQSETVSNSSLCARICSVLSTKCG